jgi:hypothetical protein
VRTRVYYALLDPNKIFGSVGRCGGGYNTVWEDWSPDGRAARENIMREYEEGLNKICGHYDKLERSIMTEGFRNPVIITCGDPVKRRYDNIPPEILKLPKHEWLILEGVTGGSRLWVAQKHDIVVPCIINDNTGRFTNGTPISSTTDAIKYFKDKPKNIKMDVRRGFSEGYDNSQRAHHMEKWWTEENIVKYRAPLWVSTMNKYGYYVDRLQPFVLDILRDAGVVQPEGLKKRFPSTRFYIETPKF